MCALISSSTEHCGVGTNLLLFSYVIASKQQSTDLDSTRYNNQLFASVSVRCAAAAVVGDGDECL